MKSLGTLDAFHRVWPLSVLPCRGQPLINIQGVIEALDMKLVQRSANPIKDFLLSV